MGKNNKILIRNFDFIDAALIWRKDMAKQDVQWLKELFESHLINEEEYFVKTESNQGYEAVLWCHLEDEDVNVSFILDGFKSIVISQGYYNYMSDVKEEFLDGGVRLTYERHYLKPLKSIKLAENEQIHFGNIHLQNCIYSNNGNRVMKVFVNHYPGDKNKPLTQLIKTLLDTQQWV